MIIFQKNFRNKVSFEQGLFRNKASFGTRPLSDQRKKRLFQKKVSFKKFAIFQKNVLNYYRRSDEIGRK